ncbi:MAG: N-acetylglucosamine kinase [Flavobacteriaceae bacterium]|nr:N-acetylglucosamine kinase [Flavobacteriaceae bacterium]MBT3794116.1 N-acetylglucosamine kinase [Flavobacteriaceae bacterium]MBT4245776.1 N-acetylglucosamine kinase [Flavobacteriaceae bacterium]MBT5396084.1 N-acetylglucosamine kinase [Flavobacteriaceae bacterium]MBT5596790.1 N-acetylglucosamine kinase [Flavobacteriaceae bacterium]
MKIIVDSGSTKTDWIAIDDGGNKLFETQTLGLNPQVLTEHILEERIINNYDLYQIRKEVTKIYFYGAGCGTEPPNKLLKKVFTPIFVNADINIKEDTYAAVYSCCKPGEKAIVSIIGTGSNCSYFDGNKIHQKITSLGYVLMDDASGNYFGRQLLRDYYFNMMPKELGIKFKNKFNLKAEFIKDSLYKKPNPNTYLAKFAKFLIENKDLKYSKELIKKGFTLFIKNQINQFENSNEVSLHFVGSVGFYLQENLKTVLESKGLKIGKVIKKPIDGLVSYHQSIV